ncbi:Conserved_hypothetical protein [Hexamita inflata]|uniref:START domain-containing protein n=1 Tax=Hexamita inflata TaxID=28002 RepID=A0AA86UJ50_9EUKA|nr:Conserved hypothetical protein [Hexamita inflata]
MSETSLQVDPASRQVAIDSIDGLIEQSNKCEQGKERSYRKCCVARTVIDKSIKWHGIYGKVTINAKMSRVLSEILQTFNTSPKSPEWLLKITEKSSVYFFNDADKQNHSNAVAQTPFSDFVAWIHNCVKSPVPLVQSRDAVCLIYIKQLKDKIYLTMQSVEAQPVKGYTRSIIINQYFTFTSINNQTQLESFLICDPSGSVPAFAYNLALDARNDILVNVKEMIEGSL